VDYIHSQETSCDLKLRPMTLTYELDVDIVSKFKSYCPDTGAHTDRTDCYTWTTKVVVRE